MFLFGKSHSFSIKRLQTPLSQISRLVCQSNLINDYYNDEEESSGNSKSHNINNKKYVVVTGGVISGIGKGITASSIGVLVKMLNLRPTAVKIDPYLNVDAGTMSPMEHGETYVLDDGAETDLDLGNYERFLDVKLTNDSNLTTGKVYETVIKKERKGDYLGKTVQIIPHITNEIINRIENVAYHSVDGSLSQPDVCVIELGGTIGDIESMPFVEALRQLQLKVGRDNFCLVHVSMVPTVGSDNEQKTKPTQHSVKELRGLGLAPDFIVCRCKLPVTATAREKIALFCNVPPQHVISIHDVDNIYHVPLVMIQQHLPALLSNRLDLPGVIFEHQRTNNLGPVTFESRKIASHHISMPWDQSFKSVWDGIVKRIDDAVDEVEIALVGKYTSQSDAYLSVVHALKHSCISTCQKLRLRMIESTDLESEDSPNYSVAWSNLRQADGVLIPGGFGTRGIEGKIAAVKYARENKIPFLGICLGLQVAVIEYSRTVLGLSNASSEEFDSHLSDNFKAIVFMPEGSRTEMGGTMRLGARDTILKIGSIAHKLYGESEVISERHRHRYEVNPNFIERLQNKGLVFSGRDISNIRMEICEIDQNTHPYFVGVQFHPEFKSRPQSPAPVFLGLLQAAKTRRSARTDINNHLTTDKVISHSDPILIHKYSSY
eukprot:CAMPEP_0196762640 /NCGR_PEP_ID=MMETSP1095-20130614/2444_1 /TAXON_ID=96789 ORGANISM="Chromulina nebulosa, Strain UTEXLB2642" /NCGR_SAMPLE_ID=MMETSP1095 /ASSEMBLY_ACC=CAM_ASM_000446 /LENGTH=660 /DNA_ID=CAMNT_0042114059 /DNA_START=1 /DNA_END=1981 /DNA_ORIENTATION=+